MHLAKKIENFLCVNQLNIFMQTKNDFLIIEAAKS